MKKKVIFITFILAINTMFFNVVKAETNKEICYSKLDIPSDSEISIINTNVKKLDNIRLFASKNTNVEIIDYKKEMIALDINNTFKLGDNYSIIIRNPMKGYNYYIFTKGKLNENNEEYNYVINQAFITPKFNIFDVVKQGNELTIKWTELNGVNEDQTKVNLMLVHKPTDLAGENIGTDLPTSGEVKYNIASNLDTGTYYVKAYVKRTIDGEVVGSDTKISQGIIINNINSPAKVTGLTAQDIGNKKVKFTWNALSNQPDKYLIYVYDESGKTDYLEVKGNETEYTSTNFGVGAYTVKIYASKEIGGKEYFGEKSEEINFEISLPTPPNLTIAYTSSGNIYDRIIMKNEEKLLQKFLNKNDLTINITSDINANIEIFVNDKLENSQLNKKTFTYKLDNLKDGAYNIKIKATNNKGDISYYYYDFEVDTVKPYLEVLSPLNGDSVQDGLIKIKGQSEPAAIIKANGITVNMDEKGFFDYSLLPKYSLSNEVDIIVSDYAGNETKYKAFLANETHEIKSFDIKSEKETMYIDEEQLVYVVAIDILNQENMIDANNTIFSIINGKDIATIDKKGKLIPLKEGIVTIKASINLAEDKKYEGEIKVRVINRPKRVEPIKSGESDEGSIFKVIKNKIYTSKINSEQGGKLNIGKNIGVDIPPLALLKNTRIEAKLVDMKKLNITHNSNKIVLKSQIVDIKSSGGNIFKKPVLLSFNLKEDSDNKDNYAIYYYNEKQKKWLYVGGEIIGNNIVAEISHLTKFAVFQKKDLTKFNDIYNHWAKKYINILGGRNIASGVRNSDGSYSYLPNEYITRAEFAKLVTIMKGYKLVDEYDGNIEDFKDIPKWAMPYMQTLLNEGILKGKIIDNKRYLKPNDKITREEIVTILSRMYNYKTNSNHNFTDSDKVSNWASEHLSKMVELQVISGYPDNSFRPKDNATRAGCAKMISRMLDVIEGYY